MPARYEAMRDAFKRKGMSDEEAKAKAARIYNATRKPSEPPLSSYVRKEKRKK